MSTAENFEHVSNCEKYNPRGTLLDKYKIPIHHLDFEYVKSCSDASKLEKILEILKSGEEGHYPDLMQATEDQLRKIRPNSKALRTICPVLDKGDLQKDMVDELAFDLENWVKDVSKNNKELSERKVSKPKINVDIRTNFKFEEESTNKNIKEVKIKSTDYQAWDKYDPDTELLKIELEEEKLKNLIRSTKRNNKKSVTFNQFATEAEAYFNSDREMEKGKEFFKSGDLEEALQCFTNSILSKPSLKNYNNRALTHLKLQNFDLALTDIEKVLSIDPNNLKALFRKAQALEGLKKYEEALDAVEEVIELDPNNVLAQELAERVRRFCEHCFTNTKMKIVELE